MEDGAFAGQDVVGDAQPGHGRQVGPDDAARDVPGQTVLRVPAVLDGLHDGRLPGLGLRMGREVGGNPGVEVPAVVIELAGQTLEVLDRQAFELHDAEDDVDDLDARVVDVVLDLDALALVAEASGQGVAEAGVAKMADVGRLVRVDVGVLDDDLALIGTEVRPPGQAHGLGQDRGPVQPEVEKTSAGDLGLDDALDRRQQGSGLQGDGPRRLPERLGQSEREGQGQVAHLRIGRRGHLELPEIGIHGPQPFRDGVFEAGFEGDHFRRPIITEPHARARLAGGAEL